MSDGIESVSRVGLESIAPAVRSTRVRRDDQGDEQGGREQPREQPEPEDEDDGRVHVDVRE